jgi:predicted permease
MRGLRDDIRDAIRSLRKQPRFLLTGALTLALGIGSVTAIFSVVNGVLFTPLPYPNADRLVNIWSTAPGLGFDRFPLSPDLFLFYQRHNTVFDEMAVYQGTRANLTEGGPPEVVDAAITTHRYFSTLGAPLTHGRAYTAEEDRPEAPRVAVISHRLWTRRYQSDPAFVGRTIRINAEPTQVVGIAPAVMDEPDSPDIWQPARFNDANPPTGSFGWAAIGRLKPGVRPEDAAAQLEPLVQRAMSEYIQSNNYKAFLTDGRYRPLVHSMLEDAIGSVREPLWILLGTVSIVLLIACGNVANLCLVRADARQRELAVRTALGGSRSGLLRLLLAESLLLSVAGTILGVLFAALMLPMLIRLAPTTLPRLNEVRIDVVVLLFAVGAALIAALLVGLVPAIRYTRPAILSMLRHGGRSATDHPSRQRGRQLLVVGQTALALILLVGSGLLARSFVRLMRADHGFSASNTMTFRVALPQTTYPEPAQVSSFIQRLTDAVAALPDIESAGAASAVPLGSSMSGTAFEFEGRPVEAGRLPPIVNYGTVTPGYFRTLRVPVLRGEDFTTGDLREGVRHVIVNKAAAESFWPGQDPLGERLRPAGRGVDEARSWFTVKGVVGDVRQESLREPPDEQIFFSINPGNPDLPRAFTYVVRGPHVEAQAGLLRQAVWSLNADLPIAAMQMMDEVVQRSIVQFTFTMMTLGIAAAIALLLGVIGLYGVLAYSVRLRTREIGVRLALGAPPARVRREVITRAALIMTVGLVLGVAGAVGLTRFLESLLYETEPLDLVTFAGMSALLFLIGLIAAYLPARQAASVSPLEAMRTE